MRRALQFVFWSLAAGTSPAQVTTTWDGTTSEGWTLGSASAGYWQQETAGGNPGGYVRFRDTSCASRPSGGLIAPASYLGDLTQNGRPRFEFDVRSSLAGSTYNVVIIVTGPGGSAEYRSNAPIATSWTRYVLPFDEMHWDVLSGSLCALFVDVQSLVMYGDIVPGCSQWEACVDNVTLAWDAGSACPTGPVAFCFGDGSGTACPCGNASAPADAAGCLNSLGSGARLTASGTTSVSNDTLTLDASGMPESSSLFFQGTARQNAGLGATFGDGLRCASGTVTRLAIRSNLGGAATYPSAGDPAIATAGMVITPALRTYQVWYRNAAAFCASETFNLTNGIEVLWRP